jgi:hypothetical protein
MAGARSSSRKLIGVHHDHFQIRMIAPRPSSPGRDREAHDDGAAGPARSDNQNTHRPLTQKIARQSMLDAHISTSLRARTA